MNAGLAMIPYAVGKLGASNQRPAGALRINSSAFAARGFLEPHLGEFRRRYPLVHLEIVIGDGCDAGIRLRESVNDSMIAIPISPPMAMAVVGSPALFAGQPPFDGFDLYLPSREQVPAKLWALVGFLVGKRAILEIKPNRVHHQTPQTCRHGSSAGVEPRRIERICEGRYGSNPRSLGGGHSLNPAIVPSRRYAAHPNLRS